MQMLGHQFLSILLLSTVGATIALPSTINVGYVSFDLIFSPNVGQFDITNGTGANSTPSPDTTFPVTNTISLSGLSLLVNFNSGPLGYLRAELLHT